MAKKGKKVVKDDTVSIEEPSFPSYVKCAYQELVPVTSLNESPHNPNRHTETQVSQLAKILAYTGIRKSIIVSNLSGKMVTGHGTLQAIKKNGWAFAPVDYQDFEDADQEYAHMVADNSMQAQSWLDKGSINFMLQNLGPDLDLAMFGFENFVLDLPAENVGKEIPESLQPKETRDETGCSLTIYYTDKARYEKVLSDLLLIGLSHGTQDLGEVIEILAQGASV